MATAVSVNEGSKRTKETHLTGVSILLHSSFTHPDSSNGYLEIGLTSPEENSGAVPEDSEPVPRKYNKSLLLTLHLLEDEIHYDAYDFVDRSLDRHTFAKIPDGLKICEVPEELFECDYDDSKIDCFGMLIKDILNYGSALSMVRAHPQIASHPVYFGLLNNNYHQKLNCL